MEIESNSFDKIFIENSTIDDFVESEVPIKENCKTFIVKSSLIQTVYTSERGVESDVSVNKAFCTSSNDLIVSTVDSTSPSQRVKRPKNVCEYCNKTFKNSSNCFRHMYNIHKKERIFKSTVLCIECKIRYNRISQLREHLSQIHNLEMNEEEISFANINEFKIWKCELERKSLCKYVKLQGIKKSKNGNRSFYMCHRSGKKNREITHRKRNMKAQGSCKLGISCTSTITTTDSMHGITVKYCKYHYGHAGVSSLIKISPQEQNAIEATVEKGTSYENVLEELQDSLAEKDPFQYNIVQSKDIERIKKALHAEGPNSDVSDTEGLNLWVQSCNQMENSPVLLYRPEHSTDVRKNSEDSLVLIIMTEYQKHILLASSMKVVCIDKINRRKGSRYFVISILVIDENGFGFPTVFCLCTNVNRLTLLHFFDTVKQTTGCLETEYFMSDGEELYYDTWREVMLTEPKWLWNIWYVDTFWKSQLRIFKGNCKKRGEVYSTMRTIVECQSNSVFTSMLEAFITSLSEEFETKVLGKFLEQHYVSNVHRWAYCYRKDLGAVTSINLEVLHRTLVFCAREGFKTRLDKYIFILMKLVRDKILDRLTKIDSAKLSFALVNIGLCHKKALDIHYQNILPLSVKEWVVLSEFSSEKYHVTHDFDSCPDHCNLICEDCDICVHMFSCTCNDNLIDTNLCEHIHAVAVTYLVPKFSLLHSPGSMSNDIEDSLDDEECIPHTSEEVLHKILKKTRYFYRKIKSNKCSLSNFALHKILENLNESLDICDGGFPLSKCKEDNPAFKKSSNIATPANNSANQQTQDNHFRI